MAHGEATRPLETTDGKAVDRAATGSSNVLLVQDPAVIDLLKTLIAKQDEILEILGNLR